MNIEGITDSAHGVVALLREYSGDHVGRREMLLDPILFGYLQGRYGNVSRQHPVQMHGHTHAHRIDFRIGGNNPVVMEFAVRPPNGGGNLYGSQNRPELRKLARVTATSARLRLLLLVDLSDAPILRVNLKPTYDEQNAGPGNFVRHSVRIIYVQANSSYNFLWQPN